MTTTFKPGDRVVCVDAKYSAGLLVEGQTYVAEANTFGEMVRIGEILWKGNRFRPAVIDHNPVTAPPIPVQQRAEVPPAIPASDNELLEYEGRHAAGQVLSFEQERKVMARVRSLKATTAEAERTIESVTASLVDVQARIREGNARTAGLIEANNAELERRRAAEAERDALKAGSVKMMLALAQLQADLLRRGAHYCMTNGHIADGAKHAPERDAWFRRASALKAADEVLRGLPAEAFLEGAS